MILLGVFNIILGLLIMRIRSQNVQLRVENRNLRSDLSKTKSRAKSLLRALDCKADTDITRFRIQNYAKRLSTFIRGHGFDK